MSRVAIIGGGPVGAATTYGLAASDTIARLRWIDEALDVVSGKALDIQQAGPVEGFHTALEPSADILAAVGAEIVVVADSLATGEWHGDEGLALVRQLTRAGSRAAFVFPGARQTGLMEQCRRELHVAADRIVGTAPTALLSAVRAVASLELGFSAIELTLVGRPPAFVIGWSAATAAGILLTDQVAPHRLRAVSALLPRLWPPGPQATGAATAMVIRGLLHGSRGLHAASTIVDGEFGARGVAVTLPLALGGGRVLARLVPSLSAQERTEMESGLGAGG